MLSIHFVSASHIGNKHYPVSSFFADLSSADWIAVFFCRLFGPLLSLPKSKPFVWKGAWRKAFTSDRLQITNPHPNLSLQICLMRHQGPETNDHLFPTVRLFGNGGRITLSATICGVPWSRSADLEFQNPNMKLRPSYGLFLVLIVIMRARFRHREILPGGHQLATSAPCTSFLTNRIDMHIPQILDWLYKCERITRMAVDYNFIRELVVNNEELQ